MLLKDSTEHKNCLPPEQVVALKDFQEASKLQRDFLAEYLSQGAASGTYDALAAMQSVLSPTTKHVEIRAHQMMNNRRIQNILDAYFRRSELDRLLADINRAVKRSTKLRMGLTPATVRALQQFSAYVAKEKSNGCRPCAQRC